MRKILKPNSLALLLSGGGLLALLLRQLMAASAIDGKGLLISGHPLWIGLLVLTAAAALALLLGTRTIQGPDTYRDSFPDSMLAALGCVPVLITAMRDASQHYQTGTMAADLIGTLTAMIGALVAVAAAISFLIAALCRLTRKQVPFLCHGLICVHFALKMLALYQTWSFDPQVHDYCFQLFACIALTLTAYQLAAFDAGKGSHRALWFWGLAAVYLSFACLDSGLFYAAGGSWALTNLSSLRLRRERRQIGSVENL